MKTLATLKVPEELKSDVEKFMFKLKKGKSRDLPTLVYLLYELNTKLESDELTEIISLADKVEIRGV